MHLNNFFQSQNLTKAKFNNFFCEGEPFLCAHGDVLSSWFYLHITIRVAIHRIAETDF